MYYRIRGPMSLGSAGALTRGIAVRGDCHVLVLDLQEVPFVDTGTSIAIEESREEALAFSDRGVGK
jgi:hypothetical protein